MILVLVLWLCAFLYPLSSDAADAAGPHGESLKRVEDYLNAITTIAADFTQVAPDGSLAGGKFFLKRPGKMRWQYDPPTPILMIANGSQMVYYDYQLQQVSYIPIDSTLASFLARGHISLTDPFITIEKFEETPGMVRLTLHQADKPEAGKLTLEFSDSPLQIRNMVITDAQGQVTTVALNNAQFGAELERKMFEFEDPRKRMRN
ncbi:MAG: outer membrane lipoprotein carrier protein LolA [Alphaproteobacteria bacterium]|nr:outer membrane lipoprotein carrier protein LolA [Alphaproteobacteria bacterium]